MKFYIASHSREMAEKLQKALLSHGYEVTSRWIIEDTKFHLPDEAYTPEERTQIAILDEEDVRKAEDGVILLAGESGQCVPGGKHVETGIALGLGRPVYVVGRRENIFHWHPKVQMFQSVEELLEYLASLHDCSSGSQREVTGT